jgi:O-antigen biosynthesis alpha-1,2-mannosyltransferase
MTAGVKLFDSRWDGGHGIGRFSVELFPRLTHFRKVELSGRPSDPMDPWRLGSYLRRVRPVLYFSPGYNAPVGGQCRFALTVYDLNHLHISENGSLLKRLYYSRILRPALHRAEVVFTLSDFSKRQILEWSGIKEEKMVKITPGISGHFLPSGDSYASARPYLLYVGSHAPHKNLHGALRAFASSGLAGSHDFVMTGEPPKEMRSLVARLGVEGRVRFLGRVPDPMLPPLYRGAAAVVFVSLYEGFGMPIIEAMACGVPVLTSNATSMPEAAGGAAVLVDPRDVEEIAHGMRKIVEDEALRHELRKKGLEWSARYRWEVAAKEVGDALGKVA